MSEESWGRSVERERDVGRSIVGRWSAERDLLWYSCLSMAPWFLQRLLRDRQALSGGPGRAGTVCWQVWRAKKLCGTLKTPPGCTCSSNIPVFLHVLTHLPPITYCTLHYFNMFFPLPSQPLVSIKLRMLFYGELTWHLLAKQPIRMNIMCASNFTIHCTVMWEQSLKSICSWHDIHCNGLPDTSP